MVLFTTVGSNSGSLTAQVRGFRARSVHLMLFNAMASATPTVTERAECYSSAAVAVEDFPGAEELPLSTQSCAQTSVHEVLPRLSVVSQSAEARSGTCSSEDEAEDSPVIKGVVSRLSFRDWRELKSEWYRLESAWYRWFSLYEDSWQRRFSSNAHEDTSDSDCDSTRSSIREFQSTQDLRVLDHAWYRWLQFVEQRRCYSDGFSDDSFVECEYDYDPFEVYDLYCARIPTQDCLPPQHIQNSWRRDCTISFDESDLDGTWELPSLTASECAGELEMIRYAICLSTMAFEEDAAGACRSSLLGARGIVAWPPGTCSLCLPNGVTEASLGKKPGLPSASAHQASDTGEPFDQARSSTAQARPSPSTSQSENGHD